MSAGFIPVPYSARVLASALQGQGQSSVPTLAVEQNKAIIYLTNPLAQS